MDAPAASWSLSAVLTKVTLQLLAPSTGSGRDSL